MNNTCVVFLLFVALVSCALSSYLDIPPPPERPIRFKTREQIENYLKAIKDYYDAFKIKLVRRDSPLYDIYSQLDKSNNDDNYDEDDNDGLDLNYYIKELPRNSYIRRRYRINRLMNI
ncbi:unnamed protein product [Rotaria sp. Silwood1]|nr:unnamed protein product [Rotaria sp. Silwood1]CAF0845963.1 unnamed protein product [Rotaria sp. Silwood1]CAF0957043.1 unnamed protein product [Rotaria sp. Silwood1]CAF3379394.1 unnamed protein product [Rotaria sp. Silwood1]CAF3403272.1 unnamed protein product [Rotaria sp. Silwood1]